MKRLLAVVLCGVLAVSVLTGCKGPGEDVSEPTPTPTVTPVPTPTPIPTPEVPVIPDAVVTAPKADDENNTTSLDVEIHGEAETVTMTAVNGSFASQGGPNFTVLVDTSRYQVNDVGGYCYITLGTGMSGDVYAELGFRAGQTADSIGVALLNEYGVMSSVSDLGSEELGNHTVRHLRGDTIQNVFDAYLLDTDGGCITMVVSATVETAAHQTRLIASLGSLTIS